MFKKLALLFSIMMILSPVYATVTPQVIDTIQLNNGPSLNHPAPIGVNPQDGAVFVASYDGGNLLKYDPSTKSVVGELKGFIYPEAVQIYDNRLYVASFNSSWVPGIYIYDAETLASLGQINSSNWYIYSMKADIENNTLYYGTLGRVYEVNLLDNSQKELVNLNYIGINGYCIFASNISIDKQRNRLYITCAHYRSDGTMQAAVINFDLETKQVDAIIPIGQNPAGFDYRYDADFDGENLFVTQMYASRITVVDMVNNVIRKEIENVSWPQKLVLNHSRNRLYVVDNYADKFHIIDTENLTLVKSFCPGDDPSGVCVDEVRERAYTSNHWSQDIGVVSCSEEVLLEKIPFVPATPLDVNVVGDKLFVTNGPNSGISIIDSNSHLVVDRIMPFSYAGYYDGLVLAAGILNIHTGELVADEQLIYTVDEYNQSVAVFNVPERKFINHIGLGKFPSSITRYGSKIVYPYVNSSMLYIALTDGNITENISLGQSEKSSGVGINITTGKAYVADYVNHQIAVVDLTSKVYIGRIDVGFYPMGVAVNPLTNKIYVTNYGSDSVAVIDGNDDTLMGYIEVGKAPWGVEVNEVVNRIYVVNSEGNTLAVINGADNSIITTLEVGQTPRFCGLDKAKGRIYVPNQLDGTITVVQDIATLPPPPPEEEAIAKAVIKVPFDKKKISGNAVTVIAEVIEGKVSGVLFQYKHANSTQWTNICGKDVKKPYHVYWNVSALANGEYLLRAIAYNRDDVPDPDPGYITVFIDDVNADIIEDGNPDVDPNCKHKKAEKVDPNESTEVCLGDGTKAHVPPGAIKETAYLIIETQDSAPVPSEKSVIKALGAFRKYEFSDGTRLFDKPIQITLPYLDDDGDGIVDGTSIKAKDLVVMYFDEQANEWRRVETGKKKSSVELAPANESENGAISVRTDHFTLFGLFYFALGEKLDDVIIYPNPYKPYKGHTRITFDGLTENAEIQIYTVSGRPVITLKSGDEGTIEWDVKNDSGEQLASGVYIYCIRNDRGQKKIGKIAVIR